MITRIGRHTLGRQHKIELSVKSNLHDNAFYVEFDSYVPELPLPPLATVTGAGVSFWADQMPPRCGLQQFRIKVAAGLPMNHSGQKQHLS
jgi:hypothetical protein